MNKKVSIKAICAGVVIGFIGSSLSSVASAIVWGIPFIELESGASDPTFLISDLLLSMAFVFLSGYVAGKIGKNSPVVNSLIVGTIQLIIIILGFVPTINLWPAWYTAATFLAIVPTAYFGGKIAMRGKS